MSPSMESRVGRDGYLLDRSAKCDRSETLGDRLGSVAVERAPLVHREELACPFDAFELVRAAIREREPGAGDEIAHRARHEDLVRAGHCRDARGGVDGDAAQRALVALDLAGVHAGPRFEAEFARCALDGARALHRFAWIVEVGEQTVTRGVHLHAAV